MIDLVQTGAYTLSESRHGIKLLRLGRKTLPWVVNPRIGSLLILSLNPHVEYEVLSKGVFRLYNVMDEAKLVDLQHLELEVGEGMWQGYLLPGGLPTTFATRKRIIPTRECITHNPAFRDSRLGGMSSVSLASA